MGFPTIHDSADGMLKSTSEARVPPTTASNMDSARRYRTRRPRLAPIAWRIDSSRSRIAPRTCIMPEMFRHTTRSTAPDNVNPIVLSSVNWELMRLPIPWYVLATPALFSFVFAYCWANWDVTVETAALAFATLTPDDRRPWMCTHWLPRSERTFFSSRRSG